MTRLVRGSLVACLVFIGLTTIAFAQIGSTGALSPGDAPGPGAGADNDVASLIAVLEDEAERNRLIARLKQLQAQTAPSISPEDDVLNDLTGAFKERQRAFEDVLQDVADSWQRIPEIVEWLRSEWGSQFRRQVWFDVSIRLGAVFAAAFLGRWLVRKSILRRGRVPESGRDWRRLSAGIAGVAVFAAIAYGLLHYLEQPYLTQRAGTLLIFAVVGTVLWRQAVALVVGYPDRRVLSGLIWGPLGSGLLRAGTLGIAGFYALKVADLLGLPWSFHGFAERVLFLIVAIMLCTTILRIRIPVAEQLRQLSKSEKYSLVRLLPLRSFASVWHIVAMAIVILDFLFWSFGGQDGSQFLAKATLSTIAIAAMVHLSLLHVDRALSDGLPTTSGEPDELLSEVQERASRYTGTFRVIFRGAIFVAAALALAWVWDTGFNAWLTSPNGKALISALLTMGILIVATVFLCEAADAAAKNFIGAVDDDGAPRHSNRARTLASILKNVVIVLAILAAVMLGLSTIGVDAAALLAGAGVIGLAIGFGSQRLVQDLINGLFILLSDTVRVGDVVEVAGKAGVVEALSMRTITLRAYDGNVHTVPYSSIDTITNMTKEFSFAVLDIGVAYDTDVERVMREMVALDAQLRREWPYRRKILAPLEIAGVDALGDSAVMIKARSKVRPGEQWTIRREFTKRIKARFDEIGVEIPFPHRTIYFASQKSGSTAPPQLPQEVPAVKA